MISGRVYVVTNIVNNKQYVGQTITKYSKRGHGHALKSAYKKYGRKCFTYESVVDNVNNELTLDYYEKFWSGVCGSLIPNGYNLEEGGRRGKIIYHKPNLGKRASEKTKIKMSASQKEYWESLEVHPNKGRKASEETKAKMSEAKKKQIQSEETRRKRSESIKAWHKKRKEQL